VGVAPGEEMADEDFRAVFSSLAEQFEKLNAEARQLERAISTSVSEALEA
jgi:type I restriction enzyme M protein